MSEILRATRYVGRMGRGVTRSHLLEADDGRCYVVKFKSNPFGCRVLANELVAAKLGTFLSFPVAEGTIIRVDEKMIRNEPALRTEDGTPHSPGLQFGSLFHDGAIDAPTAAQIRKCVNAADAPKVIAFDHWIGNGDRVANRGNLILAGSKRGGYRMVMIDHGHAFCGPRWTVQDLIAAAQHITVFYPVDGGIYGDLAEFIVGSHPFGEAVRAIAAVSVESLEQIVGEIPDEWGLSIEDRNAMISFLTGRQLSLGGALARLRDYFPRWRTVPLA